MPSPHPSLAELLGSELPRSVRALPPGHQQRLADLIAEARAEQSRSLTAAFEASFQHLPFPLRRLVRRVLLR